VTAAGRTSIGWIEWTVDPIPMNAADGAWLKDPQQISREYNNILKQDLVLQLTQ